MRVRREGMASRAVYRGCSREGPRGSEKDELDELGKNEEGLHEKSEGSSSDDTVVSLDELCVCC